MQNRHDETNDDSENCDLEQENIIVKIRYIFEMKERIILVDRVGIVIFEVTFCEHNIGCFSVGSFAAMKGYGTSIGPY